MVAGFLCLTLCPGVLDIGYQYFRITDPRTAVFQIQNLPDAIELLTQATLRNIIAQMTLDDTFSSREQINNALLSKVGALLLSAARG